MRKYQKGCVEIENWGLSEPFALLLGFRENSIYTLLLRQAVTSPKSWNFMGVCLKKYISSAKILYTEDFFQLLYTLLSAKILYTLLSTTSVKVQQITYVIFDI